MKHFSLISAAVMTIGATLAAPAHAQDETSAHSSSEAVVPEKTSFPSPNAIVDAADPSEWVAIEAEDLLVMTLAPNAAGEERKVVIQLMPAPFSQGWVANIRKLARAKYYDGLAVIRVQDNYVTQWGDPADSEEDARPLPEGLKVMEEGDYEFESDRSIDLEEFYEKIGGIDPEKKFRNRMEQAFRSDQYSDVHLMINGWPTGFDSKNGLAWPVHCYGMVGVARGMSPSTGDGSSLYTVIGHAPRHLDRNIALAGRVISGMEHLSSLPRGKGTLGFYTEDKADRRTEILSVEMVSDMAASARPAFEFLSTDSISFTKYAEARANRRDPFFIKPAGGADICNIPVPVRPISAEE